MHNLKTSTVFRLRNVIFSGAGHYPKTGTVHPYRSVKEFSLVMSDVDEHEAKIQRAIAEVRHRNFERYGIDEVDEAYVRGLSDRLLDMVLNAES